MGLQDEWPITTHRDMRGLVEGFHFLPTLRMARCQPKGLWVTSRKGVKTHMYAAAVAAWNRHGSPRLGAMTRCGQFFDNVASEMHPDTDNLCDRCLFAEIDGTVAVYMLVDANDEVVYVGVTVSPAARLDGHKSQSPWWPEVASARLEIFPNDLAARRAERQLIKTLRPQHNIDGNPDRVPRRRVVA